MSMGWNQGAPALKVAHRFAQQILGDCFGEDRQLMTAAGTHIHSITGTVSSLVELGLLLDQKGVYRSSQAYFRCGASTISDTNRLGQGQPKC